MTNTLRTGYSQMKTRKDVPECPVATTVGLIGNKWKLLVLRDVLTGPKRFGELLRSLEGINPKVLTENLKQMEADGLLIRTEYEETPPRVEYRLSELGEAMRPIIAQLEQWGLRYKALLRG